MRFRTLDELTSEQELTRLLTHTSSFESTPRQHLQALRRQGSLAEYGGVFAVEKGEVVGQTLVFRAPYAFPHGSETLGCIAAVTTRPDHGRSGVAQEVLREVHRREREAGEDHVALWTNLSWGAHRLYEKLGYRDIYLIPRASRLVPPGRRRPLGRYLRPGRKGELDALDELHRETTRERWGFTPRTPHHARTEGRLGYLDPGKDLRVYERGGRIEGYAFRQRRFGRTRCPELIASTSRAREALVDDLERSAPGGLMTFDLSAATDSAVLLRRRGYRFMRGSWYRLLGASLRRPLSSKEAVREFGTSDPRFVCHIGDQF